MTIPFPVPRFDPLQVLAADDLNALAGQIDLNIEAQSLEGVSGSVPSDAKIVAKIMYQVRESNGGAFVDVTWPGGPFDGLIAVFPQAYGESSSGLHVNTADTSGASLIFSTGDGQPAANNEANCMILAIGWMNP